MGLAKYFRRNSQTDLTEEQLDVAQYYEIGEYSSEDCEGCPSKYPSSLNIEDGPLFKSARKAHGQILIATGQDNWLKSVEDEKAPWGKVCQILGEKSEGLASIAGGPVRINGTDLDFEDADKAGKVGIIVLPQFIRLLTDEENCVKDVENALKVKPGDKLVDGMTAIKDRGYILLCSHKTRDKRCGITAPILKQSLEIELRHEGLYRDPDDDESGGIRVVFCSHVGGHKFAANAIIYQNNGMAIMLGRMRPDHAGAIVKKTIQKSIVPPEYVRFCNKLESYTW